MLSLPRSQRSEESKLGDALWGKSPSFSVVKLKEKHIEGKSRDFERLKRYDKFEKMKRQDKFEKIDQCKLRYQGVEHSLRIEKQGSDHCENH